MKAESLLTKFEGVRKAGSGWLVKCPAHNDVRSSLSIGVGDKGAIVMLCHAGCETTAILEAVGLKMKDLFPTPQQNLPSGIIATYDYCDVSGTLLYQVCRKADKSFLQRRPDGSGGWIWKTGRAVKRVPYRLPELIGKQTVFVVEGEKDADALWAIGLPATTNAGGAGKWGASETKALRDAGASRVIIIPDNDGPGVSHANNVAARCKGVGLAQSIIQLPDLTKPGGDVSDWLAQGYTKEDLENIVQTTPFIVSPSTVQPPASGPIVSQGQPQDEIQATETHDPDALTDPTRYAPAGSDGVPYDIGAAEAFRDRFGDRVRYDHTQEQWLIWSGHFWKPDTDGEINRLAKRHVDLWQQESMRAATYPNRAKLVNFTLHLDKRGPMDNMLIFATKEKPIATSGDLWDRDPWLLGVPNGVVDLRTGALRDGQREDWITKQVGTTFVPEATCPRWEQFLDEVMCGDGSMIDYIHRSLGYSLTGDMREQCFFLLVGEGSNGKSIFLDTLEVVWGAYGHRANMRIFVGGDGEKYHLAELEGRRLIFAAETKPGQRMNEHTIKNFTGGESQSAERKFGQPFTFKPIGKIWLGVNHHPRVMDDSYGFWRRVRMIRFENTFTGSAEDRTLREKLRAEAQGILAWAIRGCCLWQQEGLQAPDKVVSAVDEYQTTEDPLTDFFNERCEFRPDSVTSFRAIYSAYTTWAKESGIQSKDMLSSRAMGAKLKVKLDSADLNGQRRYRGIEIKAAHMPVGLYDQEHSGE